MNKSLNSSNSKENQPIKGGRQTTLFDMKFKSKIVENPNKTPERSVLGDSNKKLNVSVPEIMDLTSEEPNESMDIESLKMSKKPSPKKQKAVEDEIIEMDEAVKSPKPKSPKSDGAKTSPKFDSNKAQTTEDDPLTKKMKISNFFVRVPMDEVAAAKAKVFAESAETIKKAKDLEKQEAELNEMKKKLEVPYTLGKRVFDSDEKFSIQNQMFGDLVSIVEFYNTFSSIYDNKNQFKYVAKRDKIEFTKIRFDDLVSMLNANMETRQSRKYYSKLIEGFLRILLKYESNYEKYSLFGTDLINSELDENNLQDLCRIITTLVFKEHHENEVSEKDLLLPNEQVEERHQLLKELRISKENEWFKSLSLESRLELLTLFCEQVLYGENFMRQKENLEAKMDSIRASSRELKSQLKEQFGFSITLRAYDKNKDLKIPPEIQEDETKKSQFLKIIEKIEEGEAKLKGLEHSLNKFCRVEPLSMDTNRFLYWNFSCMDGIILEKRGPSDDESGEMKSEWYSFTTMDELDNLISLLQHEPENSKLVSALKSKYEKIFGQKSKMDLAKEKKKDMKQDIGKMLAGEANDSKKAADVDESKRSAPRNSTADNSETVEAEKKEKYLTIEDEFEEEVIDAKHPPSQFKTSIDKLLEKILHNQQKASLNEEEYVAKKQEIIPAYFAEHQTFEQKFSFIKKRMIEAFENFSKDGHLKAGICEGEKPGLWKQCVENSKSLSNLHYLNFLLTKQVNWQIVNQKKKIKTVDAEDEEAELRARRRMARDELAESRPYSLRTLKKVNYDADEKPDELIHQHTDEEDGQDDATTDEEEASEPASSESESESEYEDEKEKKNQRRAVRNSKRDSNSSEESGRRSARLSLKPKPVAEEDTGRRRSVRLSRHE